MSKAPFPFPIQFYCLELFCHPSSVSPLHAPALIDGDAYAGNGFMALRASRGLWHPTDFQPCSPEAAARLKSLPWTSQPPDGPDWQKLDDIRGNLYRYGAISLWTQKNTFTPTPVWRIADNHLIRLSFLQLLARLPNCEIFAGDCLPTAPLYARFNGGQVIIPRDRRLTTASFSVFRSAYHVITGDKIARSKTVAPCFVPPPKPEPAIDDWPPVDHSEI